MQIKVLFVISGLVGSAAYATASSTCTDLPLTITVDVASSGVGIGGDGAPYVNGQGGVKAVVQKCNSTYDATLNLNFAKSRVLEVYATQLLYTEPNVQPVSWTLAQQSMFFNINNVVNSGYAGTDAAAYCDASHLTAAGKTSCVFTTYMSMSFVGPDRGNYNLKFVNLSAEALPAPPNTWYDSPNMTSLVQVTYTPAQFSATGHAMWDIVPLQQTLTATGNGSGLLAAMVATLSESVGNTTTLVGQYNMPFHVTMQAQ